mgnify:CR=1 FL=1
MQKHGCFDQVLRTAQKVLLPFCNLFGHTQFCTIFIPKSNRIFKISSRILQVFEHILTVFVISAVFLFLKIRLRKTYFKPMKRAADRENGGQLGLSVVPRELPALPRALGRARRLRDPGDADQRRGYLRRIGPHVEPLPPRHRVDAGPASDQQDGAGGVPAACDDHLEVAPSTAAVGAAGSSESGKVEEEGLLLFVVGWNVKHTKVGQHRLPSVDVAGHRDRVWAAGPTRGASCGADAVDQPGDDPAGADAVRHAGDQARREQPERVVPGDVGGDAARACDVDVLGRGVGGERGGRGGMRGGCGGNRGGGRGGGRGVCFWGSSKKRV